MRRIYIVLFVSMCLPMSGISGGDDDFGLSLTKRWKDPEKRDSQHAFKINAGTMGVGPSIELNLFKNTYAEFGSSFLLWSNRSYVQLKYALVDKRDFRFMIGVDLSSVKYTVFDKLFYYKVAPLMSFRYKKAGLFFAMREPIEGNCAGPCEIAHYVIGFDIYLQKTKKRHRRNPRR